MKIKNILILASFIFLLASCATNYRVTSDFQAGTNFSKYKTYKILNHEHGFPVGANRINQNRIEDAIDREMQNLGFDEVDYPDLELFWYVKIRDIREQEIYRDYYTQWMYLEHVRVYDYKEGTLVVDLIDRRTNRVVWHGKTKGTVYEDMDDIPERINIAVKALLNRLAEDAKLNIQNYAAK